MWITWELLPSSCVVTFFRLWKVLDKCYLLGWVSILVLVATRLVVFVQVRFQCKGFITFSALIILKGRMCLHVSSKIGSVCKTFPAVSTSKRLIPSMRPAKNHFYNILKSLCWYLSNLKWPLSSQGLEKAFPHVWHLWLRLCVSTCMLRAGMLTYILPQTPHFLAVLVERLRWVCLCLLE